jgi:hypothetical protein
MPALGLEVDTTDLLRFIRYMDNIPKKTGAAIARGLNTVGERAVRAMIEYQAEISGLDPEVLASLIEVKKATPDDLTWEMDASKISTQTDFSRPWDIRDASDTSFDDNTLVKVVTSGDEHVCEKCLDVADHSPWTLAEIRQMNPYGSDFGSGTNLVHPNCRCITQDWQATRVLPVRVSGTEAPPELFTMRQLGRAIADEMEVVISAKD